MVVEARVSLVLEKTYAVLVSFHKHSFMLYMPFTSSEIYDLEAV